jgi:hypothetical protein
LKEHVLKYYRFYLYAVIFLYAVYFRFSTSTNTIIDLDSGGYINASLSLISGGEFELSNYRSYAYPLFTFIALKVSNNINSICTTQHLLGLLSGFFLIIFVEKVTNGLRFQLSSCKNNLLNFINILTVAIVLLDGNTVMFEKMLRPEGLVFPSLLLTIYLCYIFFKQTNSNQNLVFISLVLASSFFILLHPRLSLGYYFIIASSTFFQSKLYWKDENKLKKLFPVSISLIAFFIVQLPNTYLSNKYNQNQQLFAHKQFFYSNAYTVLKALNDGNYVNKEYDNTFLKYEILSALTDSSKNITFPALGYNIDYLQYNFGDNELVRIINSKFKTDYSSEYNTQYEGYYKAWIKILFFKYPFETIKKTLRQLFFFFFHPNLNYLILFDEYYYDQFFEEGKFKNILTERFALATDSITFKTPKEIVFWSIILNLFIRPLLLIASICYLILIVKKKIDVFNLNLFVFIHSSILLVALTHTFDLYRYPQSFYFLIIMLIFFCSLMLLQKIKLSQSIN